MAEEFNHERHEAHEMKTLEDDRTLVPPSAGTLRCDSEVGSSLASARGSATGRPTRPLKHSPRNEEEPCRLRRSVSGCDGNGGVILRPETDALCSLVRQMTTVGGAHSPRKMSFGQRRPSGVRAPRPHRSALFTGVISSAANGLGPPFGWPRRFRASARPQGFFALRRRTNVNGALDALSLESDLFHAAETRRARVHFLCLWCFSWFPLNGLG